MQADLGLGIPRADVRAKTTTRRPKPMLDRLGVRKAPPPIQTLGPPSVERPAIHPRCTPGGVPSACLTLPEAVFEWRGRSQGPSKSGFGKVGAA